MSTFGYFVYIHFYLTPVANANAFFFGDRLLAQYVKHASDRKILIIDPQPRYTYSNIVLADSQVTKGEIASFRQSYSPSDLDTYQEGNLTVMRSCPIDAAVSYDTVIVNSTLLAGLTECPALVAVQKRNVEKSALSLVSPKDSGEERRIYGDTLCEASQLRSYVHPLALSDFSLENMSTAQLCSTWVVRQ